MGPDKAINNFQPGDVAGPVALPPGEYTVALVAVGDPCSSPIHSESLAVPAGSATIVAWTTTAQTSPDLTVFANDTACTAPGTGRVTARHVAGAAGAVNVVTGETVLVPGLAPGAQAALDAPVGTYPVEVKLVEGGTTVLGPVPVGVTEGKNLMVHVVSALSAGGQPASAIVIALDVGVCSTPAPPVPVPTPPRFTG